MAHQLFEGLSDSQKRSFRSVMLWDQETVRERKRWVARRPENQFVNPNARISPDEDFASSVEHFLFDPGKLKQRVPQAHAWIQDQFGTQLKLRLEK